VLREVGSWSDLVRIESLGGRRFASDSEAPDVGGTAEHDAGHVTRGALAPRPAARPAPRLASVTAASGSGTTARAAPAYRVGDMAQPAEPSRPSAATPRGRPIGRHAAAGR
jgi:hypothetical protein